mgnify:CR=1 FL=1
MILWDYGETLGRLIETLGGLVDTGRLIIGT